LLGPYPSKKRKIGASLRGWGRIPARIKTFSELTELAVLGYDMATEIPIQNFSGILTKIQKTTGVKRSYQERYFFCLLIA
jgi:hypothetical protein